MVRPPRGSSTLARSIPAVACFGAAVLMSLAALLPACASSESFRPAFAPEGMSVIYIFRTSGGGPFAGGRLTVLVNQEPAGAVGAGEYMAWAVGPGEHLVRVEGNSESTARVVLGPNESAFLEIRTGALGSQPVIEVRGHEAGMQLISNTREAPVLEGTEMEVEVEAGS